MSQVKATFVGSVVADVESRTVGASTVYEFPVYVNHARKDKTSGEYVKTGDVTKIRVAVWNDIPPVMKGDLVEVVGTLVEKEWDKRDGSKGRMLQTEFVDSVTVKSRRERGDVSNLAALGATEVDAPF